MNKTAKRISTLVLAFLLCFSMCACFGGGSNGVTLTLENYTSYLKVSGHVKANPDGEITTRGIWLGGYTSGCQLYETAFQTQLAGWLVVENLAPNYNYEGVEITVKFTATPQVLSRDADKENPSIHLKTYEFEGTFKLTAGGTPVVGQEAIFELPDDVMASIGNNSNPYVMKETCEIIGITGRAVPA